MSKKIILIGSGVLATAGFLIDFSRSLYCYHYQNVRFKIFCSDSLRNLPDIFLYVDVFVPIFVFGIITYFLNEKTFIAWRKFTLWWIIVSFVIIAIAPTEDNFFGNIQKLGTMFSTGGYAVFATLLILYKSYKLRGK